MIRTSSATRPPRRRAAPARAGTLLLASAVLAVLACSRPTDAGGAPDVSVAVTLQPDPPAVGPARLEIALTGPDGAPWRGACVSVEGNMDHAGMRPVFADLAEVAGAPGRHAGTLEFTMGGDWFLLVRGTLADGRAFERQVDVKGVRTP